MNWQGKLENFIPFLDFLADTFGDNFEFVLHDFSKPNHTIIGIRNGHITGRQVGDSISDFTLRVLKEQIKSDEDFEKFRQKALFRKELNSADYIIRDDSAEPIGLFSINYEVRMLYEMKNFIENILRNNRAEKVKNLMPEKNAKPDISFKDFALSIIDSVLDEHSVKPSRMTAEEKIQVISKLNDKGIFQLKGIISDVAEKLCVSEATVYRYLSNL